MAGTFSQIYIQVVFAVKGRECVIHTSWEEELYKYISGIVRNKEAKKYCNPNRFLLFKKSRIFSIGKYVFTKFINIETRYKSIRILIVS